MSATSAELCAIDTCGRPYYGAGMCRQHYQKVKGHPLVLKNAIRAYTPDEFLAAVEERGDEECWEWLGSRNPAGYGVINVGRARVLAHRYSAERLGGLNAEGLVVRHKCDNPPCVNPAHLEVGTRADNNRDTKERGRRPATKRCRFGHEMTDSNTKIWKTRDGHKARACRECNIRRVREWHKRQREKKARLENDY